MNEALEPGSYRAEVGIPLMREGSSMCLEMLGSPSLIAPPQSVPMSITFITSSVLVCSLSSFLAPLASAFSGWLCHFPGSASRQ
jgi:hypothetical protein